MFEPGTLLAGKYRIDRVLGQGGMGLVVAATHVYLSQRVALKFLLPEFLHDATTVERFLREARAAAALRGEHVCRVSDVGTLETGSPYIVMELLDGADLATVLATSGPLPTEKVSHYLLQACLGLAEAHALGIVHRDLKPANLFVTRRLDGMPLIKVLDFGIAKARTDAVFHLTRTASVMGSPGYMSPEQLRSSRDADARSDIWALGVILYELVSGRPPFVAESITELALRVAMDPLPPLQVAVASGFDRVIARCLEKDPARRFQDVAALAQALVPFAGAHAAEQAAGVARVLNLTGPALSSEMIAVSSVPTTLGASAGSATSARRSVRWGVVAGAAAVVAATVVVALTLRGGSAADDRMSGSAPAVPVRPEPVALPVAPAMESPGTTAATAAPASAAGAPSPAAAASTKQAAPSLASPAAASAVPAAGSAAPSPAAPAPAAEASGSRTAATPTPGAADTAAAAGSDATAHKQHMRKPKPPGTQPPASPSDDVGASRF